MNNLGIFKFCLQILKLLMKIENNFFVPGVFSNFVLLWDVIVKLLHYPDHNVYGLR